MDYIWNLEQIYSRGITGRGITTAVLDTGIYSHRAFLMPQSRIKGFCDFVNGRENAYDDNGHGTHVSGIIAGNDREFRRNRSFYGRKPGIYAVQSPGVAPESEIVGLKVLDREGNGKMRTMIRAIDWLITHYKEYNVRIVNISVGMPLKKLSDPQQELLVKKVEQLWDLGLVVVVAAGNEGPDPSTVTIPGISRKVITVGALEERSVKRNHRKKQYSGCGPVPGTCVCKPDVIAPATGILSCDNTPGGYVRRSGTSMAAPVVSGILALLLSYQPRLSNLEIKIRIMETSQDVGLPKNQQGWGVINPEALLV